MSVGPPLDSHWLMTKSSAEMANTTAAEAMIAGMSKGKLPVVWFHCRSRTAWAALHTVKRHGGRIEQVVVLELQVPRSWLRRSRKGLWYCPRDVPPERVATLVRRIARGDADSLSGRFLHALDDLDDLLAHLSEIEQDELYAPRLRRLKPPTGT